MATLLAVAVAGAFLGACEQPTHEERVSELRAQYEAEVNGIAVKQAPRAVDVEIVTPEGEDPGTETAEEAAEEVLEEEPGAMGVEEEGEEGVDAEEGVIVARTDVILDIVVRSRATEPLPGITVDVSHADAEGSEKGRYQIWVDTSDLARGSALQVDQVLEGVDYEEGDGFYAEVRHPIPPVEWVDYREFSRTESPE